MYNSLKSLYLAVVAGAVVTPEARVQEHYSLGSQGWGLQPVA